MRLRKTNRVPGSVCAEKQSAEMPTHPYLSVLEHRFHSALECVVDRQGTGFAFRGAVSSGTCHVQLVGVQQFDNLVPARAKQITADCWMCAHTSRSRSLRSRDGGTGATSAGRGMLFKPEYIVVDQRLEQRECWLRIRHGPASRSIGISALRRWAVSCKIAKDARPTREQTTCASGLPHALTKP